MTLKVIRPVALTDAMLIDTTVPESEHPTWASGTTYALGDRVMLSHRIWESLQNGNTGNDPAVSPTWWANAGPTNRWAAWDASNSTSTAQPYEMSFEIDPGAAVNVVAAVGVVGATSMRVRLVDESYGVVYDETADFSTLPQESDWWNWFFGERVLRTLAVFRDIPAFPAAHLLIDLEGGAELAVGTLMFGQLRQMGVGVSRGLSLGIRDYSRKEVNEFGDVVLTRRSNAKRARAQIILEESEIDSAYAFFESVTATPCLWLLSDIESTVVYGWFEDLEILLKYVDIAETELTLQGLT